MVCEKEYTKARDIASKHSLDAVKVHVDLAWHSLELAVDKIKRGEFKSVPYSTMEAGRQLSFAYDSTLAYLRGGFISTPVWNELKNALMDLEVCAVKELEEALKERCK